MNKKKLFQNIIKNRGKNISFSDFQLILEAFGFRLDRTKGSHRIYDHKYAHSSLNIQDENGQAKPYQVQQFLKAVEKYNLKLED